MEGFLGQIIYFGGNFAPRNFSFCDGTLIPVSQNTALFSIISNTFGGDGRSTFALPDTRGRMIIGSGMSTVDPYTFEIGTKGGSSTVTLTHDQLPDHTHSATLVLRNTAGNLTAPSEGSTLGATQSGGPLAGTLYSADPVIPANAVTMSEGSITVEDTGGNSPFSIMPPYTVVSSIICVNGVYPSRQ